MKQEIFLPEFLIPFECDSLIRVGEGNDGSYLVDRSSIDMSEILISIGVGITFDFEKSVLEFKKIPVIALDGSAGLISQLKKIKFRLKNIIQYRNKDYIFESFEHFFKPFFFYFFYKNFRSNFINKNYRRFIKKFVGNGQNHLSFDTIFKNFIFKNKFDHALLQIDIEGGEYDILNDILTYDKFISGLVIEFHDIQIHENKIKNFIENFSLSLVHTHINNIGGVTSMNIPKVVELTFSKNKSTQKVNQLPHTLDKKNSEEFFDYILNF